MEFITYTRDNSEIDVYLNFVEEYIASTKGIDKELIESVSGSAVIQWNFEFEKRVSGIKNLEVVATSVGLDVMVEHYASDDWEDDDLELLETEFDLSEHIKDFKIETEANFNGCLYVEAVEIDFKEKKILINF